MTEPPLINMQSFSEMADSYFRLQCRYSAAIREVQTKLEVLNEEFNLRYKRNPIHHMQSRLKTNQSIAEKLKRRGHNISFASATANLYDIAGIRVICSYTKDIYMIANLLKRQDDVRVIKECDYIKNPKKNGYRSLHIVIEIPVFLAEGKRMVPVEVQIRTITMDFWASLDHQLRYKEVKKIPKELEEELIQAAYDIAQIEQRMQKLHNVIENIEEA